MHRVYRVTRAEARQRYGSDAASVVPADGLNDVHRYLVITLAGQDVVIDITFPGDHPWDGHHSMSLACGDGRDFPAGEDPAAGKAALEASYCDPQGREPFIAALVLASARTGRSEPLTGWLGRPGRNADLKYRVAWLRIDSDGPGMAFGDDAACDVQAEAGSLAGRLGGEEGLERAGGYLW